MAQKKAGKKKKESKAKIDMLKERKDHTKTIITISLIIAVIMFLLAAMNAINAVNMSIKGVVDVPTVDTDDDGVPDAGDGVITEEDEGYDVDGDGIPDQGEAPRQRAMNFVIFGILSLIGPFGFYASAQYSRIKAIERRLPDFLRDVAEAGRFGMTLADSILVASSGRYGLLTPEIKKMAAQIEWGVPATEALRLFVKRVNTPVTNKVINIIIKANDSGGNVADVLTMVAHNTKENQIVEDERQIAMSTYLAVIYIAFFVFLATIIILNATFLPRMEEAGQQVAEASADAGGSGVSLIDVGTIPDIQFSFFIAVVVHAIGDGVMAGVIDNGQIPNGLRHATILLALGFLIMTFV